MLQTAERQAPSSPLELQSEAQPANVRSAAPHWSVAIGVTVAFVLTFLLRFQAAEFVNDHFTHLSRARQLLLGEWPIRDFFDPGQFLHYYFSAAAQIIFGYNLYGEALLTVSFLALAAALSYFVSWQFSRSHTIAACTTALEVMALPRLYNYPKVFLYAAAVWLAWWYAQRPTRARTRMLAAFTVFSFLFRYDHGFNVGVFMVVLLLLLNARTPRQWLAMTATYTGFCCLLLLPFAAYVQWAGGLRAYITASLIPVRLVERRAEFQQTLSFSAPQGYQSPGPRAGSSNRPSDPPPTSASAPVEPRAPSSAFKFDLGANHLALAGFYWATVLLPFAALLTVGWAWWRGTIAEPEAAVVAATALFCVLLWRTMMVDNPNARLADVAAPVAILSAWPAGQWVKAHGLSRLTTTAVLTRAAVLVLFLATAWSVSTQAEFVTKLVRYRFTDGPRGAAEEFMNTYRRLHLRPIYEWAPGNDQHGIRALAHYVMRCTSPQDRLLIAGAFAPEVYFYAERPFAGGMVHFMRPWHASLPEQRLTIERLQHQRVPIALIEDADSFQHGFSYVADYVRVSYVEVAYSTFNGDGAWHVLVDRHRTPVGVDPALGLPCYRPPGQE